MKTIVITGSTRGIGLGLAENFLLKGCRVVISGRSQRKVDQITKKLGQVFGASSVAGQACDITNPEALEALWDFAEGVFTTVDVWINNAGMSIFRAPLHEQSPSDIQKIVDTNLTGLLLANQVALKGMHSIGEGQIWNMEGFGSNGQTVVGMAAYGATKSALTYINKSLQKEVKGSRVQVCTLSPGIVVTDLLVGDYDPGSQEWEKSKKILNILGDSVETVTPFLVEGILAAKKSGSKVAWLTNSKAFWRFMTAAFRKRDLFSDIEQRRLSQ